MGLIYLREGEMFHYISGDMLLEKKHASTRAYENTISVIELFKSRDRGMSDLSAEDVEPFIRKTFFHGNSQDAIIRWEPIIANIALGLGFRPNEELNDELRRLKMIFNYMKGLYRMEGDDIVPPLSSYTVSNTSMEVLEERFGSKMDEDTSRDEKMANMYDSNNEVGNGYTVERVDFDRAYEIAQYTGYRSPDGDHQDGSEICYAASVEAWDEYTNYDSYNVYALLKDGYEGMEAPLGDDIPNAPKDDYGTSIIFLIVDEEGEMMYSNTRWNHMHGDSLREVDKAFSMSEISELLGGVNFSSMFGGMRDEQLNLASRFERIANGEDPSNVFDFMKMLKNGVAYVSVMGYGFLYDVKRNKCVGGRNKVFKSGYSSGFDDHGYCVVSVSDNKKNIISIEHGGYLFDGWVKDIQKIDNSHLYIDKDSDFDNMVVLDEEDGEMASLNDYLLDFNKDGDMSWLNNLPSRKVVCNFGNGKFCVSFANTLYNVYDNTNRRFVLPTWVYGIHRNSRDDTFVVMDDYGDLKLFNEEFGFVPSEGLPFVTLEARNVFRTVDESTRNHVLCFVENDGSYDMCVDDREFFKKYHDRLKNDKYPSNRRFIEELTMGVDG